MISNCEKTALSRIMTHQTLMFNLTGSRFFGSANTFSDYDFFVEESAALSEFLSMNGFVEEGLEYGPSVILGEPKPTVIDQCIVNVWRKDNIHMQVIRKGLMWKKELAQKIIFESNLLCKKTFILDPVLRKIANKLVWRAVMATIGVKPPEQ